MTSKEKLILFIILCVVFPWLLPLILIIFVFATLPKRVSPPVIIVKHKKG